MKIKMFSHDDLDGIGCGILGLLTFNEVDVEYCNYNCINKRIENFIKNKEYMKYDHTYITDISMSDELGKNIDKIAEHLTLVDHHPTATHLSKYWWATIKVEDKKGKCSGTSLFYQHLDNEKLRKDNIIEFVEIVRQYDTWEWATIYNNENPKKWNDLLYIYGKERFIEKAVEKLKGNNFEFDETDLLLLELEESKKEKYFKIKEEEMVEKNIKGYQVGIVFAEQYISELGNYLAKKYNELDFIILIGSQSISYRGIRDDINLGLFAKQFGGGGHPKASGSGIDKEKQIKYIENLFLC